MLGAKLDLVQNLFVGSKISVKSDVKVREIGHTVKYGMVLPANSFLMELFR